MSATLHGFQRYRPRYQRPEDVLATSALARRVTRSSCEASKESSPKRESEGRITSASGASTPRAGSSQSTAAAAPLGEMLHVMTFATPKQVRMQNIEDSTARKGVVATPEWMKPFRDMDLLTPRRRVDPVSMHTTPTSTTVVASPASASRRSLSLHQQSKRASPAMLFGADFEDAARRRQALYLAEGGNFVSKLAAAHALKTFTVAPASPISAPPSAPQSSHGSEAVVSTAIVKGSSASAKPLMVSTRSVTFIDILNSKKQRERLGNKSHSAPTVPETSEVPTPQRSEAGAKLQPSGVAEGEAKPLAAQVVSSASSLLQQYKSLTAGRPSLMTVLGRPVARPSDQRSAPQPAPLRDAPSNPSPDLAKTHQEALQHEDPRQASCDDEITTAESSAADISCPSDPNTALTPQGSGEACAAPSSSTEQELAHQGGDELEVYFTHRALRQRISISTSKSLMETLRHDVQVQETLLCAGALLQSDWLAREKVSKSVLALLSHLQSAKTSSSASSQELLSSECHELHKMFCDAVVSACIDDEVLEIVGDALQHVRRDDRLCRTD